MRALVLAAILFRPAAGRAQGDLAFQAVVVKPGDTLWSISRQYLSDPSNWDQILKFNRLPTSDPTVALPGMTLRVPIRLIREDLRAAHLIYSLNSVTYRRKATASWKDAMEKMELFRDDTLKTAENSKAKVKFLDGDLLQLDANSMAVIKPVSKDYAVELKRGGTFIGKSNVLTAAGKITALTKNTKYSATVRDDLSTLVEVYKGKTAVEGGGVAQQVDAGMSSEIKLGAAPSLPVRIPDFAQFQARVEAFESVNPRKAIVAVAKIGAAPVAAPPVRGLDDLRPIGDAERLAEAISAYRIQLAMTSDFSEIVYDKTFPADEPIKPSAIRLDPGDYWYRVATIDLLGTQGRFSKPSAYKR
ncbi:MAG: LysM peptidoglycan-binding domain-containing protein [Elusimicrobia bacterium]|nr:LysM peptidoglycan-binding domain-containing protein [Elusimicrobiota bacterium]